MRLGKVLMIGMLFLLPGAWLYAEAGKTVRLTTYYPAPYGEYQSVEAKDRLMVPVKDADGDAGGGAAPLINNEIWVEVEP